MILGKRPRPPIRRTTSTKEFTLDLNHTAVVDPNNPFNPNPPPDANLDHRFLTATISPRNHRRNSADHRETTHFLAACHLCNRRLIPGRDIFMYRGDRAFCSFECRQQQMNQDEKKDKCSLNLKKQDAVSSEYLSDASKSD